MKNLISIIIGKCILLVGGILHRGSSLPGLIALKCNKNILSFFKLPNIVIAVTGSSGKGSTSSMIANILRKEGYSVAHNKSGANLTPGIITLLLENCNLKGIIKKDILVYEIDERYTKYVFQNIKPNIVVISNISRDQPPRQGHFDIVFETIDESITDDMHLVLNGDDPYLRKFALHHKCDITYYGIEKNKYSYKKNIFTNLNLNYCPKCNHKLEYYYYTFENMGDYYCPHCNFKRPNINYAVTTLDYKNSNIEINHEYFIQIPYNVLFCIYNTLAAFTTVSLLGISKEKISKDISLISKNTKIFDIYEYQNRCVTVLNNKNENSSTFNQSLLYVSRFKELKTIIIGWKEISRRYNFDDLSWLYDIDFEILKDLNIDKIVCAGIHRYDIATRLKLSGFDSKKIVVFDNLKDSVEFIKYKTKGNIYGILNFDYVSPFNQLMKDGD